MQMETDEAKMHSLSFEKKQKTDTQEAEDDISRVVALVPAKNKSSLQKALWTWRLASVVDL
jgi:hypothetical protein